ncbi:MAG: TPM domain-containing protein [Moraxellaceae bacterium]|nr:MAG: TPM domain-containing protein [Moraxellaceae bacterium]
MAWLLVAFSVNAETLDQSDQAAEAAIVIKQAKQANGAALNSVIPTLSGSSTLNDQDNSQTASISPNTSLSPSSVQADPNLIQATLPDLNSPVVDQANLLSSAQQQELTQQILAIYQAGRAQIGVIILPSTGQEPIFDYATRAFSQWKLGNEKTDNGLLIVVAVNDHRIQILTGYGLEGVLPDVVLKRIIEEQITPQFKQNNYAQGLNTGLQKIDNILQLDLAVAKNSADQLKQQQAAQAQQQQRSQSTLTMLVILCVAGAFTALFLGRSLSASLAGAIGISWGLMSGLGLIGSVLLGGGVFFLLISSIAQLLLSGLFRGGGGFGGGRGGGFGGGGYRGGGGSFGGGGASGSW